MQDFFEFFRGLLDYNQMKQKLLSSILVTISNFAKQD